MTERQRLVAAGLFVFLLAAGFWSATSTPRVDGGEIEAAATAVQAWGAFATTGDIRSVAGLFAMDGPQYRQLLSEAESIDPGPVYEFVLSERRLIGPGVVRGSVVVTGPVGQPETYRWDLELVELDGRWQLWTVRTTPNAPRT